MAGDMGGEVRAQTMMGTRLWRDPRWANKASPVAPRGCQYSCHGCDCVSLITAHSHDANTCSLQRHASASHPYITPPPSTNILVHSIAGLSDLVPIRVNDTSASPRLVK